MRAWPWLFSLFLLSSSACNTVEQPAGYASETVDASTPQELLARCAQSAGSHKIRRRLQTQECLYDTDGSITSLFHSTLYYPQEISLRFDGFIVGIEKSPRRRIVADGEVAVHPIIDAGLADSRAAAKEIDDKKLLFVSHILRNTAVPATASNCALYNAYDVDIGVATSRQFVDYCSGIAPQRTTPGKAFKNSWEALKLLKADVATALKTGNYTHVLVITMGWNTEQVEAVRNMNSIAGNFVSASRQPVKPLVIGVTWPSMWISKWIDPAIKVASFPSKAEDADELGLTWLGVLLHDTLPDALGELRIPVIAVGHSFGGRATITAACVGPIIASTSTPITRKPIGTTVIFQGAFLTDKLFTASPKKLHYPTNCPNVAQLVMTSSSADKANNIPTWGTYSGDDKSFLAYCGEGHGSPKIGCARASKDGQLTTIRRGTPPTILLVNADDLISEHAFGTGGGAHSDIFRHEHGTFLNAVLQIKNTGSN